MSAKLALEGRLHSNTSQLELSGIKRLEKALKESLINQKEALIIKSTTNKLLKSVSDLTTYVQLEVASLTTPLANLSHLQLEFEQYLDLVQQRKRKLFYVLEGGVKEIVAALDEDLTVFKKWHGAILLNQVEAFADEMLMAKSVNSREVVSNVENYLRKTLIETYSEFITTEDQKIRNAFQHLASEANENLNFLIGDVKQKAAQLFGLQPVNTNFHASLNFETKFYYHLDPIFMTGITFSGSEIAELLPKSLFKGILKKSLRDRTRSEFDKNGGRIRYDYFIARLNQAVLQLKKEINQSLESSTETVNQAVHEAELLRTKSEHEVKNKVNELNMMLAQLHSIRERFLAVENA